MTNYFYMKTLVVDFNGYSPTYTHYFSKAIKDNDIEVDIIGHLNESDLNIFNELNNYIGIQTKYKLWNYFVNWILLFSIAKNYDVIHFQWLPFLKYSSIDLILIKLLKKKTNNIYYTVHNFTPHNCHDKTIIKRYHKLYQLIDNLIVHTSNTEDKIKALIKEQAQSKNIIKIFHGLFYSNFKLNKKDQNSQNCNLLMAGMISEYKGFEDALEVVSMLNKKTGIHYNLTIEGKGTKIYINKLKKIINDLNLNKSVHLQEGYVHVKRMIHLYNESDITLMPYKQIEQSGVALTSLGLGTPIIAYNVGGLSDIINNNINGYLIEPGNKEVFATKVAWAFENRKLLNLNIINDEKSLNLWQETGMIMKIEYEKSIR